MITTLPFLSLRLTDTVPIFHESIDVDRAFAKRLWRRRTKAKASEKQGLKRRRLPAGSPLSARR